jgi:hypothetical protein
MASIRPAASTRRPLRQLVHGVYRIVFRGGSPQRIPYSNSLYVAALLGFVALAALTHWIVLGADVLDVGVGLFTTLCGIYLAVALLTRRVPRSRLQPSLLALWLILLGATLLLAAGGVVLQLLGLTGLVGWLGAGAALIAVSGATSVLRYAAQIRIGPALAQVLLAGAVLTAFYLSLSALLRVLFG